MGMVADYGDEHIRTLDWKEHIRRRPGMYIGKLGDGTSADDGIYILIKEVLDNSVDEYMMGFGKSIDITIADEQDRHRTRLRTRRAARQTGGRGVEDEHRREIRLESV